MSPPSQHDQEPTELDDLRSALASIADWTDALGQELFGADACPHASLAPQLRALLDNAAVVFAELEQRYASQAGERGPGSRLLERLSWANEELETRRVELVASERSKEELCLLSRCCAARSALLTALTDVERALADAEGFTPVLPQLGACERLRVLDARSAYYLLRGGLEQLQGGAIDSVELERQLSSARAWVSCVMSLAIFEDPHAESRRALHRLHGELEELLVDPSKPRCAEALLCAAHELAHELLVHTNSSALLVEYDRGVLERLLLRLDEGIIFPDAHYDALDTMLGRDGGLDYLIETRVELRAEPWRDVAMAVLHALRTDS